MRLGMMATNSGQEGGRNARAHQYAVLPWLFLMSCPNGVPGAATGSILSAIGPGLRPGAGDTIHPRAHGAYLEFPAVPAALPYVRRHTRQTLATWQLGYLADDVELVVSELVTNAVRATQDAGPREAGPPVAGPPVAGPRVAGPRVAAILAGPPAVAVYLTLDRDRLAVLIWDSSPRPPARREHDYDDESGRGLELVQALTDDWGVCPGDLAGKVVWAKFRLDGP
jgi:anti-sigma regulatory factor (Ser/Thr protein kinase)